VTTQKGSVTTQGCLAATQSDSGPLKVMRRQNKELLPHNKVIP
jgi:hypothetical protein